MSSYKNHKLCPTGWVVPDKFDSRTIFINDTGCALGCLSPYLTQDEWNSYNNIRSVSSWIGFFMMLFLVITWIADKSRRSQYLIPAFGLYTLLTNFVNIIISLYTLEEAFCVTNAVPMDKSDGSTLCAAQTMMNLLAAHGSISIWIVTAIDLYLRLVRGYRSTIHLRNY